MKGQFIVINSFRDKNLNKDFLKGSAYESDDSERIAFLQEKGFLKVAEAKDDGDFPLAPPPPDPSTNEHEFKHLGGGWYQLSNGEKIQGKEEAEAVEKELSKVGE